MIHLLDLCPTLAQLLLQFLLATHPQKDLLPKVTQVSHGISPLAVLLPPFGSTNFKHLRQEACTTRVCMYNICIMHVCVCGTGTHTQIDSLCTSMHRMCGIRHVKKYTYSSAIAERGYPMISLC